MTEANTGVSQAALEAKIAELEAKLAAKGSQRKLTLKVGEKGNVCIYGLQRFPFSFYRQQIETILDNADMIRAFIKTNKAKLAKRD